MRKGNPQWQLEFVCFDLLFLDSFFVSSKKQMKKMNIFSFLASYLGIICGVVLWSYETRQEKTQQATPNSASQAKSQQFD
jgi:hypothetical protein